MHTAQLVGHKLDGFLVKLKPDQANAARLELQDENRTLVYVRIAEGKYLYDRMEIHDETQ